MRKQSFDDPSSPLCMQRCIDVLFDVTWKCLSDVSWRSCRYIRDESPMHRLPLSGLLSPEDSKTTAREGITNICCCTSECYSRHLMLALIVVKRIHLTLGAHSFAWCEWPTRVHRCRARLENFVCQPQDFWRAVSSKYCTVSPKRSPHEYCCT